MKYPMCYDNGGETADRYTVIYKKEGDYVGMSSEPFHPQGIGQHGEGCQPGEHLGKLIYFGDLPEDCQKLVASDMKEVGFECESCGRKYEGDDLKIGAPCQSDDCSSHKQHAALFFTELINSVETLSGLAASHGLETLVELMYLQNAILTAGFIESSDVTNEVLASLPNGVLWLSYAGNGGQYVR